MIMRMNPIELPADPTHFPDQAASFMLDGPAGKLIRGAAPTARRA